MLTTIHMEEMTYPTINAAITHEYATTLVGVRSTEQNGPHLLTTTDSRIAVRDKVF